MQRLFGDWNSKWIQALHKPATAAALKKAMSPLTVELLHLAATNDLVGNSWGAMHRRAFAEPLDQISIRRAEPVFKTGTNGCTIMASRRPPTC